VRTRRDSRAGISFVHLSDGPSFHPRQVVAQAGRVPCSAAPIAFLSAADIKAVSAAPIIADRLTATGQVVNYGGPQEFADAIGAQRAKIAATAKAIDFKPKQ
jgi:tripartite-type tricarboxylate transporter receptor subunit TctC